MHGEMCRLRADPTIQWLRSHYDEVASELNIGKDSRSVPWAVQRCRAATDGEPHVEGVAFVEHKDRPRRPALTEALEKWLS